MSIYQTNHHIPAAHNNIGNMNDGSGTINPAALNTSAVLSQPILESSARGIKRSRSPDQYDEFAHGGDDDDDRKSSKRGRPSKTPRTSGEYAGAVESLPTPSSQTSHEQIHTPRAKTQGLPQTIAASTAQTSPPPKTTPKGNIKALPTVRDHTTDQLTPEGDEYTLREWDEAGEKKVNELGYPQGGRQYRIKTFTLNGRGEKLYMLATECARVLTYRDSYLLFNKNRSLFKIIASPKEKEDLIAQDILPYSYRSRQIAIVTARSMYRQFGSRVIENGRRVRDDYWEAKAKKQGFTEADAAGEKRPGAGRAREAAAQTQGITRPVFIPVGDVVYSNGPAFGTMQPPALHPGIASTMAPLPMITSHDSRYRDIPRPRHDLSGPAYSDITRSSSETEIMGQATHGAEFSKVLNQQRGFRRSMLDDYWTKPHEPAVSTPQSQPAEPATSQAFDTSPRFPSDTLPSSQQSILPQQQSQQSMNPPSYPHQQNPMQSPLRQSSLQPSSSYTRDHASNQYTPQHQQQLQQQSHLSRSSSSNLSISHTPQSQPYPGQSYSPHHMSQPQQHQQQQMWGAPPPQPQQQPHQSPALHRMPTPGYSPNMGHAGSPVHGQSQSPHPQQQPGMMGQMYGPGQGLQAYANMGMSMGQRGMYGQGPGPAQFMQPGAQSGGGQQWPGVTQAGAGQGGAGGYQGYQ